MKMTPETDLRLERAASTFAALGSEQRLTVLRTLVRAGPEGLSIGDLGARTGITGSTLTHHLKLLVIFTHGMEQPIQQVEYIPIPIMFQDVIVYIH